MNIARLTKPELIVELEKRLLPTSGLKDELKNRLIEAMAQEKDDNETDKIEESPDESEIENNKVERFDEIDDKIEDCKESLSETLNEDEMVNEADQSAVCAAVEDYASSALCRQQEIENDAIIVDVNEDEDVDNGNGDDVDEEDDEAVDGDANADANADGDASSHRGASGHPSASATALAAGHRASNSRELGDNGEHEIIEINEEVVIDDEDNQQNDNNYNDISSDSNPLQSREVESEVEKIESRKEDSATVRVKTEIWVSNIAEDVKAVELKELFGKFGKVISAKVVMNAKNPSGNCFGCIQLGSASDAKACITNLDQTEFRGNIISITNDISEKASKEKIVKNVSPASSSASWGSKKKKTSLSPAGSPGQPASKTKTDSWDKEKPRTQYRDKPDTGGSAFYKKQFPDRGGFNRRGTNTRPAFGSDSSNRRMEFPDKSAGKPYYNKPNAYGNSYSDNNSGSGGRGRDSFQQRRDGRDSYNSQYDSKFGSGPSRDRQGGPRNDYSNDKMKSSYDYRGGRPNAYDDYDKRDKPRSTDYARKPSREMDSGSKRDGNNPYRRSRPDDNDDYSHSKKRRTDLISDQRPSNYYQRSFDSPKRSSYYPDKEFRKPDYKSSGGRRDDYGTDYNSTKTDRDYFPVRRAAEYSNRRDTYDAYSPDRHASGRSSNHYSKEPSYPQHSADFGGRSRRY